MAVDDVVPPLLSEVHSREVRSIVAKPSGPGWLEEGLAHLKPTQSKLALRLGAMHHLTKSADSVVEALEDFEGLYASVELRTEEDEDEFWASGGQVEPVGPGDVVEQPGCTRPRRRGAAPGGTHRSSRAA